MSYKNFTYSPGTVEMVLQEIRSGKTYPDFWNYAVEDEEDLEVAEGAEGVEGEEQGGGSSPTGSQPAKGKES
jgi:hypothetical protein